LSASLAAALLTSSVRPQAVSRPDKRRRMLFGDGPKLTRKPSAKRALLSAKFLCIRPMLFVAAPFVMRRTRFHTSPPRRRVGHSSYGIPAYRSAEVWDRPATRDRNRLPGVAPRGTGGSRGGTRPAATGPPHRCGPRHTRSQASTASSASARGGARGSARPEPDRWRGTLWRFLAFPLRPLRPNWHVRETRKSAVGLA
jgi:hypothetical protein